MIYTMMTFIFIFYVIFLCGFLMWLHVFWYCRTISTVFLIEINDVIFTFELPIFYIDIKTRDVNVDL